MKLITAIKNWAAGKPAPPLRTNIGIIQRPNKVIYPPLIRFFIVLKFVISRKEEYKRQWINLTKIVGYFFALFVGLDLLKLTKTGTMINEDQWAVRIVGVVLISATWFLSTVILTWFHARKYRKILILDETTLK